MATKNTPASRIDTVLENLVSSGFTAGVSAVAEVHGKPLYRGMAGMADIASGRHIADDTIYRIFSMSKVITSTAALILFERGLYRMYDPLSKFIPAFAKPMVHETGPDGKPYARPAKREIRIRDLFTMTSGIPYGGSGSETEKQMARLMGRMEKAGDTLDTVGVAEKVARIPLEFDPGARWKYGFSIDILGSLICVLSGRTLGEFVRAEILDPLAMDDTGFFVPDDKLSRLASMYPAGPDGKIRPTAVGDPVPNSAPSMESGGGGMFATIGDYAAFTRMLLDGTTPAGRRILGRKTIELMHADHLDAAQKATYDWDTQRGYSYGLGVRTMLSPAAAGCSGSVGEFGWDGYAGTWMCVDPAEDLSVVFMTQRAPGGHGESVPLFKAALYSLL